jgi:hypothetical protein
MREVPGHWVLYALENPMPDVQIRVIRIESEEDSMVGVGGVTLFRGVSHPFRRERLHTLYIEEDSTESDAPAPEINVDLGVVARTYPATPVDIATWLSDSDLDSDSLDPSNGPRAVCAEVTASPDATLNVDGSGIAMRTLYDTSDGASEDGRWHVRIVDRDRTWLHGRIVDAETGKPTPARIHFRSVEGRYLPPYGHRAEVNTDWFQDYGADLKVGSTQYAYVNGDFRIEVPIGPVLVEVRKGFEYIPVRAQIEIDPGQTELKIPLKRLADRRSEGWVTADTHVHFLSPDTALLEAKAEDVNIVNLLAAQWGDLYTNVGDIRGELAGSSDADTLVWVGTENRQHFLGHISLLGVHGEPVIPFSTSGPGEGYIGDGTANPLAEWADEARGKEGLVIAPHFPMPHSEIIADVILGKIDAVEIAYWWSQTLDDFRVQDWYRLLSCGYRVPVVGGTDKMSAGVPLGGTRTYAHIGDRALDFDAWAQAVRAGRTYMTSGPLLEFEVDGRMAGSEIKLPVKGGSVHVKAVSVSSVPLRSLEVVVNGRVVTGTTANGDDQTMLTLEEDVVIEASSWIAARCNTGRMAPAEPAELATLIAAHSSPVYVSCGGSLPRVEPETGRYFLTTMQGGIEWLDTLATIESHAAQERIRHVFIDAMDELRDRMHDGSQ